MVTIGVTLVVSETVVSGHHRFWKWWHTVTTIVWFCVEIFLRHGSVILVWSKLRLRQLTYRLMLWNRMRTCIRCLLTLFSASDLKEANNAYWIRIYRGMGGREQGEGRKKGREERDEGIGYHPFCNWPPPYNNFDWMYTDLALVILRKTYSNGCKFKVITVVV